MFPSSFHCPLAGCPGFIKVLTGVRWKGRPGGTRTKTSEVAKVFHQGVRACNPLVERSETGVTMPIDRRNFAPWLGGESRFDLKCLKEVLAFREPSKVRGRSGCSCPRAPHDVEVDKATMKPSLGSTSVFCSAAVAATYVHCGQSNDSQGP